MSMFRFGIAGPGAIARRFAAGLGELADVTLAAVASHSKTRAEEFVREHQSLFPKLIAYDSYEKMADASLVDAVYISNLNTQHQKTAELFLSRGIPVLCEKPFALNAAQSERMIACARDHNAFLMEAMWTRFLPVTVRVREWIRDGRIGTVLRAYCDFGMELMTEEDRRTVAIEKGGGALLDLGVYPLSFFGMLFKNRPTEIVSTVSKAVTGVDSSFEAVFRYGQRNRLFGNDFFTATASVSIDTLLSNQMKIVGTKGYINIQDFWMGRSAAWTERGDDGFFKSEPSEIFCPEYRSTGYQYEAAEVVQCVRSGKKESDVMPLSETLHIMALADRLRAQWGIVFPGE